MAGPVAAVAAAALAGCGSHEAEPRKRPAAASTPDAALIAKADRACKAVQDASRAGPRFPFRTFDPSNPDGRLRNVGAFYVRLDTEGTLATLADDLREIAPGGELDRLVAALKRRRSATRAQTRAAVSGDREQMIEATERLDEATSAGNDAAADAGTFACALSLERNPKTLR